MRSCKNDNIKTLATHMPVEQQFELAKALAANCGYQLVAEDVDIDKHQRIKELIECFKTDSSVFRIKHDVKALIIEGLEGLLK